MALRDLESIPGLPLDDEGPLFKAPWEAQAFALAVKLQEQGLFSWQEWAEHMSQSIEAARASGDPDLGNTYYEHWVAALETLVHAKGLATEELISQHKDVIRREHQKLHSH